MKYDCVIGNPPYQDPNNITTGSPLWPKFIKKGVEILKDDGVIAFITPTTWMNKKKRGAWGAFKELDLFLIFPSVKEFFPNVGGQGLNFTTFFARKSTNKSNSTLIKLTHDEFHIDANNIILPIGYIKWSKDLFNFIHKANEIGFYKGKRGAVKPSINSDHYSQVKTITHKHPVMYSGRKNRRELWIDQLLPDHYDLKLICPVSGNIYETMQIKEVAAGRQTEYITNNYMTLNTIIKHIKHPISKKIHRFYANGNYHSLISHTPINPELLNEYNDLDCILDLPEFNISTDERAKTHGEVLTPMSLCYNIINNLPDNIKSNPNSTYIDFSAGTGNFLVALRDVLYNQYNQTDCCDRIYAYDICPNNINIIKSKGFNNATVADSLKCKLL
ncbi:MAG: Eco57I restriction-modification methylase domain-containing protein [Nitrososphaeraceae archaeon]|nr:Eco57I restriction-modification methylase domain-containing protein [Nitrososphaeraceae archaeon]